MIKMDVKKFYTKFTDKLKSKYDTIDNIDIKKGFLTALPFWTGAFITGLVAVVYAKLFSWAELGTKYIFLYISLIIFCVNLYFLIFSFKK